MAWRRRGIPVTYLLASNEGHGFGEAATALAVNRATEQFLGNCLGGRVEAIASPEVEAAVKGMLVDVTRLPTRSEFGENCSVTLRTRIVVFLPHAHQA
jgi:hypothetical protein